ncbi:MAG: hypothetical protein PVH84_14775 [Candidatus Aminicenantes bacterium]|jgi:hypothetical protein
MKKAIITLGLIMGIFTYLYGIQELPDVFIDGTKWKSLSMEAKLGYLMGFQEGLKISRTAVLLEKDNIEPEDPFSGSLDQIENWIQTYEVGETRLGLIILTMDSVYSENSNSMLIAVALLPLVTKRIRGEISADDFKARLEKLKDVLK